MELNLTRKKDLTSYSLGSFDIGIKNLCFCILDRTEEPPYFRIYRWKLINLVSQQGKKTLLCKHPLKPKKKGLTGKPCGKRAAFWHPDNNLGYCGTHKPKDGTDGVVRYTTTKNISDFELNQQIIRELDKCSELWTRCHEVVLETQMRSKMKQVTNMIFSCLTDRLMHTSDSPLKDIRIVSARNKLAIPDKYLTVNLPGGDTSKYPDRKSLAKEHCPLLIQDDPYYLKFFNSSKKADDLADSFLQGIYHLFTRNPPNL